MEIKCSNQKEIDAINEKIKDRLSELSIKHNQDNISANDFIEIVKQDGQMRAFNKIKSVLYMTATTLSFELTRAEYLALTGRG